MAGVITDFGDEAHDAGETGLTITGTDFTATPGEVWMFENADRTGAADDLSSGISWSDTSISDVAIPASPNNANGTVYLLVKTIGTGGATFEAGTFLPGTFETGTFQASDEWSNAYAFTLAGVEEEEPELVTGGRHRPAKRQPSRYPRTIRIGSKEYIARSYAEERAILQAYIDRISSELTAEGQPGRRAIRKQIRVAMRRIQTLEQHQQAERKAKIRKENEDLLALFM